MTPDPPHHGQVIQTYRRSQGLTQAELAQRIGRSRRSVVTLEQQQYISDVRLRQTIALVLTIPPHLLDLDGLPLPGLPLMTPLTIRPPVEGPKLGKIVTSTLLDNVRMRFDLYYFTNSRAAAEGLREQQHTLTTLARKGTVRTRSFLLQLLSHLYRLEGLIARDALDYPTAESCFQRASLAAQEAGCMELDALSLACRAVLFVRQHQVTIALQYYDAARAMTQRSSPVLKAYLAIGAAEVQGMLRDEACLRSLEQARRWLHQMDPTDDPLLLYRSTRCSEQTLLDCSLMCQAALGRYEPALDYYSNIDQHFDLCMPRRKARLLIQCARLLHHHRDMSCCFYAAEGFRIAKRIDSPYNMQQVRELAMALKARLPADPRVHELMEVVEDTHW